MDRQTFVEAGKRGAAKRWASRYELIRELSKYVQSKEELDKLVELKTKTLEILVKRFIKK